MDKFSFIEINIYQIGVVVNFLITIILVLLVLLNKNKINKLNRTYKKFIENGFDGKNIESIIYKFDDDSKNISSSIKSINTTIEEIKASLSRCIQNVGIIRYKAFEDVGGDQSFSISLLDESDNGVVISSIHSRNMYSTYAKEILGGKSLNQLSDEEIQAINKSKVIKNK